MIGMVTAQPCGHRYTWSVPDTAEPRGYTLHVTSYVFGFPTCRVCGEPVTLLEVRIAAEGAS